MRQSSASQPFRLTDAACGRILSPGKGSCEEIAVEVVRDRRSVSSATLGSALIERRMKNSFQSFRGLRGCGTRPTKPTIGAKDAPSFLKAALPLEKALYKLQAAQNSTMLESAIVATCAPIVATNDISAADLKLTPAKAVGLQYNANTKRTITRMKHEGGPSFPILQTHEQPEPTVKDLVCGMDVVPSRAAGKYEYEGKIYYFCAVSCLKKFQQHPETYLGRKHQPLPPATTAAQNVEYTCPMHPEVRQMGPGSCPKCGMALEPSVATLESEENPELNDMSWRFWASLVLTVPVFLLAMSEMIPGQPVQHSIPARLLAWIQLALATPVVFWGGWPFLQRGWASIVNRSLNMFTLIAIGTGTAYVYSLVAVLFPDHLSSSVSRAWRRDRALF